MGVSVVGKATNVVKTDSFAIDECAGNVATKDDRMSLARVWVSQPGQEPWLTLGYDEWIYCCSGRLVFGLTDGSTVELKAGETALVDKGTRFQPRFPEAGTSYIPVCIPAFRPDRCVREEASCCSGVAKRLAALHTKVEDAPEVLYHMVLLPASFVLGSRRRRHAQPTPSTRVRVDGFKPTPSARRVAWGSRRRRQSPRSASSPAGRPPKHRERPTSRPPLMRRASRTRPGCLLDS